jgi:hypothetical protein
MRTLVQYSRRDAAVCLAVVLLVAGIAGLACAPGPVPLDAVRAQPAAGRGLHALPGVSVAGPAASTRFVAFVFAASALSVAAAAMSLHVAGGHGAVSALARISSPLRI